MLSIIKLNPRKADRGVLLDTSIFFSAAIREKPAAQKIMSVIEDEFISKSPRFNFYVTDGVLGELRYLPENVQRILTYVNQINVTSIDDIINKITNGASLTDKGLIQAFATDPNISILVSDDSHIWNGEVMAMIKENYGKPAHIYNSNSFVKTILQPQKVTHLGFEAIEQYLQAHGKLADGG